MNKLIVIEGIDGSGKTTNALGLARSIKATYFKTPQEKFDEVRKLFNTCGDIKAKYLFYLATLQLASCEVKKLLEYTDVVADRWLTSTICYHAVCGVKTDFVNISKMDILEPDFHICLTISNRNEWLARTRRKEGEYLAIQLEREWERYNKISHLMASFTRAKKGLIIDTGLPKTEEVVKRMRLFINKA